MSIRYRYGTGFYCMFIVEGETAAYPYTGKPEETALHANDYSKPVCYTA